MGIIVMAVGVAMVVIGMGRKLPMNGSLLESVERIELIHAKQRQLGIRD